jgi:hypothetical protein
VIASELGANSILLQACIYTALKLLRVSRVLVSDALHAAQHIHVKCITHGACRQSEHSYLFAGAGAMLPGCSERNGTNSTSSLQIDLSARCPARDAARRDVDYTFKHAHTKTVSEVYRRHSPPSAINVASWHSI